jgi:hypothetical protein
MSVMMRRAASRRRRIRLQSVTTAVTAAAPTATLDTCAETASIDADGKCHPPFSTCPTSGNGDARQQRTPLETRIAAQRNTINNAS